MHCLKAESTGSGGGSDEGWSSPTAAGEVRGPHEMARRALCLTPVSYGTQFGHDEYAQEWIFILPDLEVCTIQIMIYVVEHCPL